MPKSSQRKNDTRRANRDRRARLEELKRQQRQAERRKNYLYAGSAIVVAVLLIGGAVVPTFLHDRSVSAKNKERSKVGFQATPTAAERAAGCDGTHNDPVARGAIHVPNQPIDYTTKTNGDTRGGTLAIPPSGGAHNPVPLGDKARFYGLDQKPRPERAVHNLEHGYVVAWYDSGLNGLQVRQLQQLATDPSLPRLLVVGWWQGQLPAGKHLVLTSWGRTDRCSSASPAVIRDFYAAHVDAPLAPEAGSGAGGGEQFPANDLITAPAAMSPTPTPTPTKTKK